jgi:hypothetical protein
MADRQEPSPTRKDFVHLENVPFETRERFQREMGDMRASLEDLQEAGQPVDGVELLRQAAAACRSPPSPRASSGRRQRRVAEGARYKAALFVLYATSGQAPKGALHFLAATNYSISRVEGNAPCFPFQG